MIVTGVYIVHKCVVNECDVPGVSGGADERVDIRALFNGLDA